MVFDIDEKLLSSLSTVWQSLQAAHAIVRNQRLLTSVEFLNEKGEQ